MISEDKIGKLKTGSAGEEVLLILCTSCHWLLRVLSFDCCQRQKFLLTTRLVAQRGHEGAVMLRVAALVLFDLPLDLFRRFLVIVLLISGHRLKGQRTGTRVTSVGHIGS